MRITIDEWLEDHDNPELEGYDWEEVMEEAVRDYNEEFGTNYQPRIAIRNYKTWKRDKQWGDI